MYTYYRTGSYSTNIQRILQGSISSDRSNDLILIKDYSLEWLSINSVAENHIPLLRTRLCQPTLGTIIDAQLLTCHLEEKKPEASTEFLGPEVLNKKQPYAKTVRKHSLIRGNDVIVMLSEYGKLVFLTIINNESLERPRFETLSEIYLDSPGLEYNKRGRKLAIDPSGRAIAVASFEDKFDIFIIDKCVSRTHFDPIIGRGSETEEGIIWHMSFLYSEQQSMSRILLVLVVYNDVERLCRLVLYAIDASDTNNITIEKISRLPLEKHTPSPLLLIPLNFQPESFLLITEQEACLLTADDLSCGNVFYPTRLLPRSFGEFDCALFTAFAAHPESSKNYLYLGAADGSLYRVEIENTGEIYWHCAGNVNPIGQTMCVVGTLNVIEHDNDEREGDVLLYAGEGADNEVIAVFNKQSKNQALACRTLQILDNFAPLTDMNVVRDDGHEDTLIFCSGCDTHGSLRIINHGVETFKLQSSKPDWKGMYRTWSSYSKLSLGSLGERYILLSSLVDTRLLATKGEHFHDITATSKIKTNENTVYAAFIPANKHNIVLQIYSSGWSLIDLCCADVLLQWDTDSHVVSATSWQSGASLIISVCIANLESFSLNFFKISGTIYSSQHTSFGVENFMATDVEACPSCMEQFYSSSNRLLVVGTFEPSLIVYLIDDQNVQQIQKFDMTNSPLDVYSVPSSMAMLQTPTREKSYLLVGLKQGSILTFQLIMSDQGTPNLKLMQDTCFSILNIGTCSVHLTPCLQNDLSIYALSDDLWKISCCDIDKLSTDRVLLPKFNSSVDAFIPLGCDSDSNIYADETAALLVDDKLHIFQLSINAKMNTSKIRLGETPRRVIYDKLLNYIVAITTTSDSGALKSYINLLDPINGQPLTDSSLISNDNHIENSSNTVLSAAEWLIEANGKLYTYLCVGLGHTKPSLYSFRTKLAKSFLERGTLLVFRLKLKKKTAAKKTSGNYLMKRVWSQELSQGGVYSLCPHAAGLFCSAGKYLHLYRLNLDKGNLYEVAVKTFPYIITSIYEVNGRICVTSHRGPVSFYYYDTEAEKLKEYKSDVIPRSIHHSLMLNDRLAVGVSQSGGVVGLYDNPDDPLYERRLQTLFCFHYPDILVRPSLAVLRSTVDLNGSGKFAQYILPWSQVLTVDDMNINDKNKKESQLVKPVVCGTVSGGLVYIYRISPLLFDALKVLQRLLLRYEPTKPLLGTAEDFEHWYSNLSGTETSSIHGDVIESFLRLSPIEQLEIVNGVRESEEIRKVFEPLLINSDVDYGVEQASAIVNFIKDMLFDFQTFR